MLPRSLNVLVGPLGWVIGGLRHPLRDTHWVGLMYRLALIALSTANSRPPSFEPGASQPTLTLFPKKITTRMTQRKTTAQFIVEARDIHGDRYDYSRVIYAGNKTFVEIGCPVHGFVNQQARRHLEGRGCPKCGAIQRAANRPTGRGIGKLLTPEIFKEDATALHNGYYDYSLVSFERGKDLVKIICPVHGVFEQSAESHRFGFGCLGCGVEFHSKRKREVSANKFADSARTLHGDAYDYSNVDYQGSAVPVEIICRDHGVFFQRADVHLRGSGCPKCGFKRRVAGRRRDPDDIISQLNAVHQGRYKYTRDSIEGVGKVMEIICPDHGAFRATPSNHIAGKGCPACKSRKISDALRKPFGAVIADFQRIHGTKYDYSNVTYINTDTPVAIVCPSHGEFEQAPYNHLSGRGCPYCKESAGEVLVASALFELGVSFEREWRNHDCRPRGRPLPFDFFIVDLNALIEFDGEQHFRPVRFGGMSKEDAEKTLKKPPSEIISRALGLQKMDLSYLGFVLIDPMEMLSDFIEGLMATNKASLAL